MKRPFAGWRGCGGPDFVRRGGRLCPPQPKVVDARGRAGTAPPVADEACPPQGSGPIFTARRVWKSVFGLPQREHDFLQRLTVRGRASPPTVGRAVPFAIQPALGWPMPRPGRRVVGPYGGGRYRLPSTRPGWVSLPWRRAIRESPLRCNHGGIGFSVGALHEAPAARNDFAATYGRRAGIAPSSGPAGPPSPQGEGGVFWRFIVHRSLFGGQIW